MPLRTVKTILQQIVASYGESVYQELSLLEKPENSFVYQYLFRLLNNSRTVPSRTSNDTGVVRSAESRTSSTVRYSRTASEGAPQLHQAENGMNGSPSVSAAAIMSPGRSSDIQMNLALKDIFDKIGNAQESKKGIAELYQFKLQHPEYVAVSSEQAITDHDLLLGLKRGLTPGSRPPALSFNLT